MAGAPRPVLSQSMSLVLAIVLLAGAAERWALTEVAPRHGYFGDHMMNIGFGLIAQRDGLFSAYLTPVSKSPSQFYVVPVGEDSSEPIQGLWKNRIAINYPPLGMALFWMQSKLLPSEPRRLSPLTSLSLALQAVDLSPQQQSALESEIQSQRMAAARGGAITVKQADVDKLAASFLPQQAQQWREGHRFLDVECNTVRTRAIMSMASVLADLAAAIGVFLAAMALFGPRSAVLAASVCWLCAPLAMDSSFWGQQDSWVLAPAMFMLYLLMRGRWVGAGLCLAIATLLKTQGLLLAPVAEMAAIMVGRDAGPIPIKTVVARLAKSFGAAAVAALVITLPWTVTEFSAGQSPQADRGDGWLSQAFIENFRQYPSTTMMAFNVWYLDALAMDRQPTGSALDAAAPLLGLTKDAWGKILIAAALAALAWLCWRRFRSNGRLGLAVFAGLWLWSTFIWPTRVHERYIVLCMPMIILLAAGLKRFWPAVIGLLIVGTAELSWNAWMPDNTPPVGKFYEEGVKQKYRWIMAQYDAMPLWQRPPIPTYNEVLAKYHADYRNRREQVEGYEYALTLLSLAAYSLAVFAAVKAGSHPCRNAIQ